MKNSRLRLFLPTLFLVSIALCTQRAAWAVSPSESPIIPVSPDTIKLMLEQPLQENFVPGELIVKLRPLATPMSPDDMESMGFEPERKETSGKNEYIFKLAPLRIKGTTAAKARDMTLEALEALQARPDVEYAQLNYIYQIQVTPNDPRYPQQWHYFDRGNASNQAPGGIGLPTRWDSGKGDSAIVVAVIDTGILPNHPDIAGSPNLVAGYDMISDPTIANDNDGRDSDPTDPGDAIEENECYSGSPARGNSWHGTHVAGTVGVGRTNNNTGVAGINWNVSLQAVRVLGKCGGTSADINDAIRWAAGLSVPGVPTNQTPARVINMSLGGRGACSNSPASQSAINDAFNAGVTVVVAAGNSRADAANYQPASCDNVVTVAASDYRGHLVTRYSNFGSTVEIMAPGGDVNRDDNNDGNPDGVLSMINGGYAYYNGTSMATPHVAGVAALLLSDDPSRTPQQITQLIMDTALARSSTECPEPCGAGLLNAGGEAGPEPGDVELGVSPSRLQVNVGASSTITATLTQGGQPLAGRAVAFASNSTATARIRSADSATNSSGIARATVEGAGTGSATITVTAKNQRETVSVRVVQPPPPVPALSTWSILLLAGMMLLVLPRWKRS
ncbi:MAG: S8 family serine peptidase [Pseudomonadota bacterium]